MLSFIAIVTLIALVMNLGYAGMQLWLLRRRKPYPRGLGLAICLWTLAMCSLFVLQLAAPFEWKEFLRTWLYFPLAVQMVWNILFLQVLFLGMILLTLTIWRLRPMNPATPSRPEDLSRRKFLYLLSYGAAPAVAVGMGVHGTLTQNDLRVRQYTIPVAGLPPELEGFSIAHVSDLHSGVFVGPHRLKIISDATNDLKAHLVTITGDVINNEMAEFPAALTAIQRMESRYGTYICEGNHDRIPGPGLMGAACEKNNLPWLFNSGVTIPVEGKRLILAGLPWMKEGFEQHSEIVDHLYPARQEGDVRILMAHHPHLFDIAGNTDLVLCGHTHGGQIMVGDVGLGSLFFRYWSGLYQRGRTSMVVSNGCGDWFPCRIGAPAEIGLLRLTKATSVTVI